jgi:biotin carboxyl carrier protein
MNDLILKLNNKEFNIEYDDNDSSNVIVNGKTYQIELLKTFSEYSYSYSVNQRLVHVEFELSDEGKINIIHDGIVFEIKITDETQKILESYFIEAGDSSFSGITKIKAPMPGKILKVFAEIGAIIAKGDTLLIIEAMKMENNIKAPFDCVIKNIMIKDGVTVEKDQILLEIEV